MSRSTRFTLITIIIVLILLNLATIGFVYYKAQNWRAIPEMGQRMAMNHMMQDFPRRLSKSLDLSDKQRTLVFDLTKEHYMEVQQQQRIINQLRKELMQQAFNSDSTDQKKLINELAVHLSIMEKNKLNHLRSIHNILSDDQQKQFHRLMKRLESPEPPMRRKSGRNN